MRLKNVRLHPFGHFTNQSWDLEKPLVAEFYQRCFGEELSESTANVALS